MNRHPTTALILAATVLVGCTTSDDSDLPPQTAATETPQTGETETPQSGVTETPPRDRGEDETLGSDEAVSLYISWWQILGELPPTELDELEQTIAEIAAETTLAGSPAAEMLVEQAEQLVEQSQNSAIADRLDRHDAILPRGDVQAEVLAADALSGSVEPSVPLCVSQVVEPTWVTTAESTGGEQLASGQWTRVDVAYARDEDDQWRITQVDGADGEDCVPPEIAAEVEANWDAYDKALAAWIDSSFAVEDRAALEPLVTAAHLEQIADQEPVEPTGIIRGDTTYDLVLIGGTRTEIVGEWCQDGTRDPDAMTTSNGKLVKDEERALIRGRWELEQGEWLSATPDETKGDGVFFAGAVGAPEGHRCL